MITKVNITVLFTLGKQALGVLTTPRQTTLITEGMEVLFYYDDHFTICVFFKSS